MHLLTSRPAVVFQASSAICHHPRHLASPNDWKEDVLSTMSEILRMAPGTSRIVVFVGSRSQCREWNFHANDFLHNTHNWKVILDYHSAMTMNLHIPSTQQIQSTWKKHELRMEKMILWTLNLCSVRFIFPSSHGWVLGSSETIQHLPWFVLVGSWRSESSA